MLSDNFFSNKENGQKIAYIKISDSQAFINMKKGEWWFRHPAYFQYEDMVNGDTERGDCEDNLIKEQYCYKERITNQITYPFGTIPPQEIPVCIKMFESEEKRDRIRILCFYQLVIDENEHFSALDDRLKKFGDSFAFVDMLHLLKALELVDIRAEHFDMRYHNSDYSGPVGKTGKRSRYKHQNEHRIYLSAESYCSEVQQNQTLKKLYFSLNKAQQTIINLAATKEEKFKADHTRKEIEIEICKLKSEYTRVVDFQQDFISDILPLRLIFENDNIQNIGV